MIKTGINVIMNPAQANQKHQPNRSCSFSERLKTCPSTTEVRLDPYAITWIYKVFKYDWYKLECDFKVYIIQIQVLNPTILELSVA